LKEKKSHKVLNRGGGGGAGGYIEIFIFYNNIVLNEIKGKFEILYQKKKKSGYK
jgi:hypothetical protein